MRRVARLKKTEFWKKFGEAKEWECRELAMLIDTDGTINAPDRMRPHIKVGMSSELPILMWDIWGGVIFSDYRGKKIHYEWEINERERVRAFLLAVKPYLILKKPQADIAIKMINYLEKKPPRYKEELRRLAKELSDLNNSLSPDIDLEEFKMWSAGCSLKI